MCFTRKVLTLIGSNRDSGHLGSYLGALLIIVTLGLAAAPADSQSNKMPHGSFLKRPANSLKVMLHQVRTEPTVMDRYSRLFDMSPQMVRQAFGNFHLERTKTDSVRKLYYVHTGELIGYRVRRIKKGTLVYAYPDGTPVLMKVCGNPLRPVSASALSSLPKVKDYSETEEMEAPSSDTLTAKHAMRSAQPEIGPENRPPSSDFVLDSGSMINLVPSAMYQPGPSAPAVRGTPANRLLEWVGGAGTVGAITSNIGGGEISIDDNGGENNGGDFGGNFGADNGGLNGGNDGGNDSGWGGQNGGNNGDDNGGMNGGTNGRDYSAVPEPNGLVLFVVAGAGFLAFGAVRRRLAAR